MTVRVLRLMEYTYPDADTALHDMELWEVQGTKVINSGPYREKCHIKSTTLSPTILEDEWQS